MAATVLAKQSPIVTLEAFLSTYKNPDLPQARESRHFLEAKGLLPLLYTSPLFTEFNKLVSAAIWSGSISYGTSHRPLISLAIDENTLGSLDGTLQTLETTLKWSEKGSNLGEHGNAYSRLASCIPGIFYSSGSQESPDKKARRQVTLPEYYSFLVKHYRYIGGAEKDIARSIIADSLNLFL